MSAAIAALAVLVWLAVGLGAGRKAAPVAYRRVRQRYPASASLRGVNYGGGEAAFMMFMCTIAGPLGWIYPLIFTTTWHVVPEIREANLRIEAARRRAELAELTRQIDEAHRQLGIAPLKRDAS